MRCEAEGSFGAAAAIYEEMVEANPANSLARKRQVGVVVPGRGRGMGLRQREVEALFICLFWGAVISVISVAEEGECWDCGFVLRTRIAIRSGGTIILPLFDVG